MTQLQELLEQFEILWPSDLAEQWDAPGLVTGSASQNIRKVVLSVDVTGEVVSEAAALGADLLLAHHPFLLRGVTSISEESAKGALLTHAVRANLAIFSAHTNADVVAGGVSDVLAQKLGLVNALALSPLSAQVGIGRIGKLEAATTLGEFAKKVASVLPATATGVRVAGDYNQKIETVALCGGAGDSYLEEAVAAGADLYLTSDLRHHVVQEAREAALLNDQKPALIDVSHWASEWLWLEGAAKLLSQKFANVEFLVSDLRTDPWDFVVTQ
jgi:dinuclear metal center YbgI/SA1388 family protein